MRGAWEIARLFSRSVFVYLWRLTAWRAEGRGGGGDWSVGFSVSGLGSPAFH